MDLEIIKRNLINKYADESKSPIIRRMVTLLVSFIGVVSDDDGRLTIKERVPVDSKIKQWCSTKGLNLSRVKEVDRSYSLSMYHDADGTITIQLVKCIKQASREYTFIAVPNTDTQFLSYEFASDLFNAIRYYDCLDFSDLDLDSEPKLNTPNYEVVSSSCSCHPENCACYKDKVLLDGTFVAKGDRDSLKELVNLANKRTKSVKNLMDTLKLIEEKSESVYVTRVFGGATIHYKNFLVTRLEVSDCKALITINLVSSHTRTTKFYIRSDTAEYQQYLEYEDKLDNVKEEVLPKLYDEVCIMLRELGHSIDNKPNSSFKANQPFTQA